MCNVRFPMHLRVSNATGHGTRHAFCAHAVNNNVLTAFVAQTSKHRDPSTLVGYVATCDKSVMEAALAIAGAVHQVQYEDSFYAGVSYDGSDSSDSAETIAPPVRSASDNPSKRSRISADGSKLKSASSSSSSSNSHVLSISAPNMSFKKEHSSCIHSYIS